MLVQLGRGLVIAALHGGLLNRAVHAFDLAVGPGVTGLGEAVLDAVLGADAVEDVPKGPGLVAHVAELDAVVGQHRVRPVRQLGQYRRGNSAVSILVACGCNSAKATLLVRPMATNEYWRPSPVCTLAKSTCRYPMG